MRDDLATGVEAITGHRVIAHVGTSTLEPDVTSDLFILEDQGTITVHAAPGTGRSRPNGRNRPRVV